MHKPYKRPLLLAVLLFAGSALIVAAAGAAGPDAVVSDRVTSPDADGKVT